MDFAGACGELAEFNLIYQFSGAELGLTYFVSLNSLCLVVHIFL